MQKVEIKVRKWWCRWSRCNCPPGCINKDIVDCLIADRPQSGPASGVGVASRTWAEALH